MTLTHKEIFERYMYAGAISRDPDAVAAMFTEDGVYEAPLAPDGHRLPRRLAGRDAIRAGMSAFHRELASQDTVNAGQSRLVMHDTTDADVFIAELAGGACARTPFGVHLGRQHAVSGPRRNWPFCSLSVSQPALG